MELIIKEAGIRLDKALADLTELSRSQANDEIKKGTVLVNGKAVKAKYAVKLVMLSLTKCKRRSARNIQLKIFHSILFTKMMTLLWSINHKEWWFIRQLVIRLEH